MDIKVFIGVYLDKPRYKDIQKQLNRNIGKYLFLDLYVYRNIKVRIFKYIGIGIFVITYYKVYRYLKVKKQKYKDINNYRGREIKT